jgi:RNA polymerase sigma-70 factor (ECF subfamily)
MKEQTRQAFLAAYDEHADAIYRHIFFRLLSKDKAEELSQETFLKTWQYLESGKEVDNLRPFLYRVATNLVIDYVRKKKEASLDAALEVNPADEPIGSDERDVERHALLSQVKGALTELAQEERDLITMRYIDDLDPKEIAELLGITPNHVSVKLNRAVAKLKKTLE